MKWHVWWRRQVKMKAKPNEFIACILIPFHIYYQLHWRRYTTGWNWERTRAEWKWKTSCVFIYAKMKRREKKRIESWHNDWIWSLKSVPSKYHSFFLPSNTRRTSWRMRHKFIWNAIKIHWKWNWFHIFGFDQLWRRRWQPIDVRSIEIQIRLRIENCGREFISKICKRKKTGKMMQWMWVRLAVSACVCVWVWLVDMAHDCVFVLAFWYFMNVINIYLHIVFVVIYFNFFFCQQTTNKCCDNTAISIQCKWCKHGVRKHWIYLWFNFYMRRKKKKQICLLFVIILYMEYRCGFCFMQYLLSMRQCATEFSEQQLIVPVYCFFSFIPTDFFPFFCNVLLHFKIQIWIHFLIVFIVIPKCVRFDKSFLLWFFGFINACAYVILWSLHISQWFCKYTI